MNPNPLPIYSVYNFNDMTRSCTCTMMACEVKRPNSFPIFFYKCHLLANRK